jgi:hypothetical protein
MYANDTNLFLSSFEDLGLIRSTMASTSFALGSKFNLEKTDVLPVGPAEHSLASHSDIVACFDGCYVLPPGSPLRVLGAWIGSPDLASARWDQIYSHIKKIIRQWNAIGASARNRTILAKALLLSRCSYLMDCNGIPSPATPQNQQHHLPLRLRLFLQCPFLHPLCPPRAGRHELPLPQGA